MLRWMLLGCVACASVEGDVTDDVRVDGVLEVSPRVLGQGTTTSLQVRAEDVVLDAAGASLDLGDGVSVDELVIEDAATARAVVSVDEDARLGGRDARLTTTSASASRSDALRIIAESFEVDPDRALPSEVLQVELSGRTTTWDEASWPSFGPGTEVLAVEHLGPADALVTLAVADDALAGPRDVVMDGVTAWDGFTVGSGEGVTARMEIGAVPQGSTVEFTLVGQGTGWQSTPPWLVFHDGGGPNADLRVVELQPESDTLAFGSLQASNAARLGSRDVLITDRRGGQDGLWLADALEVVATAPPIDEVATSISWTAERDTDASGHTTEAVLAYVAFVVPLDPPCGSPPPPASGAMPFDNPTVNRVLPRSGPEDCPDPLTVDAGDFVWFHSEEHGDISLARHVLPSTGQVVYRRRWTDLTDYPYGGTFDLVVGDGGRLPAFEVPGLLQTAPAPVRLLQPSGRSLDRLEDQPITWTPAQTYPLYELSLDLRGTWREDVSQEAVLAVVPWDDGRYDLPSRLLQTLDAGQVRLELTSTAQTNLFTLPFSERLQSAPTITVRETQAVFLE